MSRTVTSTDYDAQRGELGYLYQLEYSGGTLYLTTGAGDVVYDGDTYQAVGGRVFHGAIQETPDRRAQGVELQLYGVDQTIISTILSNQFRGRPVRIFLAHFDPDGGGLLGTPDLVFRGLQNGSYEVREIRDEDAEGTVEVNTRVVSSTASINVVRSVRANVNSWNEMLRRAGLSTGDKIFGRVASLMNRDVYWNTDAPAVDGGGGGGGGGGGDGGGEGQGDGDDPRVD